MVDPHADEDYFSQLQAAVGRCTTLRQLDLLVKSCDTEIAYMSSKALWKLHQTWYTEMQLPTMSEVYFFQLDLLLGSFTFYNKLGTLSCLLDFRRDNTPCFRTKTLLRDRKLCI